MTPAPDTGRTAEETELREAIARLIEPEAFSIVDTGNADPKGWAIPLVGGARHTADRLLAGPLAPILQEAATARKERDEALERLADIIARYKKMLHVTGPAIIAKKEAAEQEAATLRARLQEAEKELGWQPIATAPTDRPIVVRMQSKSLPGGWFVVTAQLPDPDDDSRFGSCSTIYHYNGAVLMGGFRGTWTHWREDAPPPALAAKAAPLPDSDTGGRDA